MVEVVVGACFQPLDGRLFACPGRQEDDWDVAQGWVGAQCFQKTEAVEAWHHHVAEDESRLMQSGRVQRCKAVDGHLHLVVRTQEVDDVVPQVSIIVDHEDAPVRPLGARGSFLSRRLDRIEARAN